MKKIILLWGLMFTLLSGVASATAVFDFSYNNLGVTGGQAYNSVSMAADGVSVDVTAYEINNDGSGNIDSILQITGADVGVYVSGSSSGNLGVLSRTSNDNTNIDGGRAHHASGSIGSHDPDEGLMFTFSQAVSLEYINFDSFSSGKHDDFNLTVDGQRVLWDFHGGHSTGGAFSSQVPGQYDEYNFNNISGTEFLIWADANSDSFRVDTINVGVSENASVPEPVSLLLFTAGLVGLGFQRRKA